MNKFNWTTNTPVTANNLNEMENILNGNIESIKPYVLWENDSPYQAMDVKNITLNSSDYEYIEIYYIDWIVTGWRNLKCEKSIKGNNILLDSIIKNDINQIYLGSRRIKWISNTQLEIGNNNGIVVNDSGNQAVVYNQINVPIKIVGYR